MFVMFKRFLYYLINWSFAVINEQASVIYCLIFKLNAKKCGRNVHFVGWPFITGINKMEVGDDIVFGAKAFFRAEGGLKIGNNFQSAANLSIYTYNHNYQGAVLPYDDTNILKPVFIGNHVWVGRNVSIVPGVSVGDGAILGMGAVITQDVPPLAIVGGNPAKILKYRDQQHYEDLARRNKIRQRKSLFYFINKIIRTDCN